MKRIRFRWAGCRVAVFREGPGRWRNYVAGPAGTGGLSRSEQTTSLLNALILGIREARRVGKS